MNCSLEGYILNREYPDEHETVSGGSHGGKEKDLL
jgi:hypothetical protein